MFFFVPEFSFVEKKILHEKSGNFLPVNCRYQKNHAAAVSTFLPLNLN
jgi:hypothetical protein